MKVLLNTLLLEGEVTCRQCKGTVAVGKKLVLSVEVKDGMMEHTGHICGNCMAQVPQGEYMPNTLFGSPTIGAPKKG